MKTTLQDLPQI